jgi:hypothetical protein
VSFVSDTFTGVDGTGLASHTGETGATWTAHPSAVNAGVIAADRLAPNQNSLTLAYASGTPATAEYDVETDFVYVASGVAGEAGVVGRLDTGALTYYMAQYYGGTGAWRLFKRVGGSFTSLGTFAQALTVGQTYRLKLEIRDAAKKLCVDGVELVGSADNAIAAAGRAGVVFDTAGSTAAGYHLDNFAASDPTGGAITATLNVTQGADSLVATAAVLVAASLSKTQGADALVSSVLTRTVGGAVRGSARGAPRVAGAFAAGAPAVAAAAAGRG